MSTDGSAQGTRAVAPGRLSGDAWSPFGWLPVADTDPRDGEHRMTFEWSDAHVNLIGHARGQAPKAPRGRPWEIPFRHGPPPPALISPGGPGVIAVAPAGVE